MSFGMKVTGLEATIRNVARTKTAKHRATAAAIYLKAEEVREDAWRRTPRDIGSLRDSSYTKPPDMRFSKLEAEVGYGMEYAIYVHERTELQHPVGEAKFLENAVKAKTKGYKKDLARMIDALSKRFASPETVGVSAPKRPMKTGKR